MKLRWGLTRPKPIQIETEAQARKLRDKLQNVDLIALDTETTGLDISRDVVVFWSLSTGNDRYFLEAKHLPFFKKVLADPRKTWIGSQIKYDANILANSGYPVGGEFICTLTMDRLLNPDQDHGLKQTYERVFNERMATFAETFYPRNSAGKPRKPPKKDMHDILLEAWQQKPQEVIDYASLDAWSVYRLYEHHKKELDQVVTWRGYSLWYLFMTYEMPFTRVLLDMERRGCQLDITYLKEMEPLLEQEMEDINKELNKVCGEVINPNSTPQVGKLLFDKMGIKPILYTSGGQSGERKPSVNVTVLKQLEAGGVQAAGLVLKYRELGKILGTYVRGLMKRADADGRIHTTFNQHVAETARLSSSDPNLQNQPRPSKNFNIRKAFIAPPGKKLIVADYDQLEMFILAHFSKDKGLIKNIHDGKDIHTGNVELVWGEPYEDVARAKKDKEWQDERADYLRELRNYVKVIGFGERKSRRSKTHSKRGNPTGAIPCCVARRSVSTWGSAA